MKTPEPDGAAAPSPEAAAQCDSSAGASDRTGVVPDPYTGTAGPSPELHALYLRHHRSLFRAARCICRQDEAAEDVVEDVFLDLACRVDRSGKWRIFAKPYDDDSRSVLDPLSHASKRAHRYLFVGIVHRSINSLHASERMVAEDPEEPIDLVDPATDPERRHADEAAREHIEGLLREIPPKLAALLHARDVEELPFEDISLLFNVPCGSLSRKLERARDAARVAAGLPRKTREEKARASTRVRRR